MPSTIDSKEAKKNLAEIDVLRHHNHRCLVPCFLPSFNQALFSATCNSSECSRTPGFAVVFNFVFRDCNRFENFIITTTTTIIINNIVVVVVTAVIVSITSAGFTARCVTGVKGPVQ
jgi:hypothetical protein